MWRFVVLLFFTKWAGSVDPAIEDEEIRARAYLTYLNQKTAERDNMVVIINWEHASNITNQNLMKKLMVAEAALRETKEDWEETKKFNWKTYRDPDLKRQFKRYLQLDEEALPEDKYKKLMKINSDMQETYATTKICNFKHQNQTKCNLTIDDISKVMQNSKNLDEMAYLWQAWHKAMGSTHMKKIFQEYVKYMNEAAKLNDEDNAEGMWLNHYETDDIKEQLKIVWEQIKPLYVQLHAYVRARLRVVYGTLVTAKGPIPVHFLGNLWAQNWKSVMNISMPYPNRKPRNVTSEMKARDFSPMKIMQTAEEFYTSMGMLPMPESFWNNSVFEKPTDRKIICHASAWDFFDGKDFRIKMCAKMDEDSLVIAHHEMGHIQYYMQYRNLPNIYRTGANDGFHEAVGDAMIMSVRTAKHLNMLGLLAEDTMDQKDLINMLYKDALSKIAALPFSYLLDIWRWDVFTGSIKPDEYNCKWWQLRNEMQGVEPPEDRYETDFDPVSKYHIVASVPCIKNFISYVLQFQFHKALCEKAGQYIPDDPTKPLHECDIYGSAAAGKAFSAMMQLGASKSWQDALEVLTGQRHMDASGLMEYFEPLMNWLIDENKKYKAFIGWEQPTKVCKSEPRPTE